MAQMLSFFPFCRHVAGGKYGERHHFVSTTWRGTRDAPPKCDENGGNEHVMRRAAILVFVMAGTGEVSAGMQKYKTKKVNAKGKSKRKA
jgi:hypothetical protein